MQTLPFDTSTLNFYKSGRQLTVDYYLNDGDDLVTSDKVLDNESRAGRLAKAIAEGLSSDTTISETAPAETAAVPEQAAAVEQASENITQQTVSEQPVSEEVIAAEQDIPAADDEAPSVEAVDVSEVPEVHEVSEAPEVSVQEEFRVVLNGKTINLEPRPATMPHEFIELMAIADIDLDNPPADGNMILTLNGKDVSFMDVIHDGDVAVIKWANQ